MIDLYSRSLSQHQGQRPSLTTKSKAKSKSLCGNNYHANK